ncbi:glucose-6-phosphate isomerase [Parasedimentitalea psychrophila]|uniref:Glucose-6-phosphate isomerase n=1 Tax=Parasedimentitalea psychrophila TaxID=2997337 RepID=A0A9Y2KZR0_9RHOB|nr:glucose-6-phosphate isomerase [Parasedimentitalea psychrophila]WIY26066.1 glucose-6-phosphate isomerase [Parasedimentitalea psychrophila]
MSDIWQQLETHRSQTADTPILSLFKDTSRFDSYSAETDGLLLDFSKTSLDAMAMDLLVRLAQAEGLDAKIAAMFRGDAINSTEGRAVLHTALRAQADTPIQVDGADVLPEIRAIRQQMQHFAEAVRSGDFAAVDGGRFTDVINIGIGGSDLGPAMATLALAPYHDGPRCHFVSNIDGAHIHDTLAGLDPQRTLVIIASKTFTTIETMTNAETALVWLQAALGDKAPDHLAAVSTAQDKTAALGIAPERVFGFENWVGGRYSLWGPVGLPILLAIGTENFQAFLRGADAMDSHFQNAPLHQNLPVLLGLVGIWHNNICGYGSRAILPYDQHLQRLPAYLQQLDMESNGKRVAQDGSPLPRASGPVVWGEPGTNGQHAFYQLLHQGTAVVPAEFLIAAEAHEPELQHHHNLLKANCLAQSEALMRGRSLAEARDVAAKRGLDGAEQQRMAAHLSFPGNRPSVTIAYPKLTPFVLGQIIALYEHRVFTEGMIWGLNPFDQWGVELGKELAVALLPMVEGAPADSKDGSTCGLLSKLTPRPATQT